MAVSREAKELIKTIDRFNSYNCRIKLKAFDMWMDGSVYKIVMGTAEQIEYGTYQMKLCEEKPLVCKAVVMGLIDMLEFSSMLGQ